VIQPGGAEPLVPRPASRAQPYRSAPQGRRTRQAATDPTRPQRFRLARGMARPRRVCPAWVGEQSKHGCAETPWQTPRRRRRTDGARLRRNPNLRRGRLHRPALPVQPRSMLRDPPRVGRAGGDSAAATSPLSCRGPDGQLNSVTSPDCAHPPARPRSWVTAQVGCWVSWPGWSWLDCWEEGPVLLLDLRRPQPQQGRGRVADRVKVAP
jgi:hypothetical protein